MTSLFPMTASLKVVFHYLFTSPSVTRFFMLANTTLVQFLISSRCDFQHLFIVGLFVFCLQMCKNAIYCRYQYFIGLLCYKCIFSNYFYIGFAVVCSSGPQPFWHQESVSWKTVFPQTRVGDGFRFASCLPCSAQPSSQQGIDREVRDPWSLLSYKKWKSVYVYLFFCSIYILIPYH